ncbi:MAG: hypothetical protein Q8O64_13010 [Sideroxyarcus sp.]|nr:hypothetical protein [Sideroxyarcus sp.]
MSEFRNISVSELPQFPGATQGHANVFNLQGGITARYPAGRELVA